jgi:hypothetical protein
MDKTEKFWMGVVIIVVGYIFSPLIIMGAKTWDHFIHWAYVSSYWEIQRGIDEGPSTQP